MNEEIEADLTKMDSRPDNLTVHEDASVDETVPIDTRKEQDTKAYTETMSKDIENIENDETRTKFNTTIWRPIYEGIYEAYIKDSKFPLMILLNNVKTIQTKHNLYRPR